MLRIKKIILFVILAGITISQWNVNANEQVLISGQSLKIQENEEGCHFGDSKFMICFGPMLMNTKTNEPYQKGCTIEVTCSDKGDWIFPECKC